MGAPLLSVKSTDKFYSGFLQLCRILKDNKIYLYLVLGKATYIFYAGAFSFWMPHFIQEEYDLSIRQSNLSASHIILAIDFAPFIPLPCHFPIFLTA